VIAIGVSLKMYFGYEETLEWCRAVREIALRHPAVARGLVELFVIPAYPVLSRVKEVFDGTAIGLGAQDLYWQDAGAFTGEVSGAMLAEVGCRYVEVGHAERRAMFGDTDDVVARKVAAALRNELVPIICIGETEPGPSDQALETCIGQLRSALSCWPKPASGQRVIVAYEPISAIGAPEPAPSDHIGAVCSGLKEDLSSRLDLVSTTIYGGSAGPGLLLGLRGRIDGLFLGRSVHDPDGLGAVLTEVLALAE
jgi:triosephosphate isomerase